MTALLDPLKLVAAEKRFVLHDVSWETYEQLLSDYQDRSTPRLTYDQGELEIMSPSLPHEEVSQILALLINVICEERDINVKDLGSTTHKRKDLLKGLEPDGCFYIQNVDAIANARDLDLNRYPPPDLVIEVDFSSPTIPKLPIYAAMGVPEIWLWNGDDAKFLRLAREGYLPVDESIGLPGVFAADVTRHVNDSFTTKQPPWLRKVREWIRSIA